MKRFSITYKKPYKREEVDCILYALNEAFAIALFQIQHPLCTIINIEES